MSYNRALNLSLPNNAPASKNSISFAPKSTTLALASSGGGGGDVLLGGQGNDVLVVNDASFKRIVGGTGYDSLLLNNPTNLGFTLDLTTLRDNRVIDIEEIDITGLNANNTLILNQREVLNLSSTSNTLIVRRNTGDVVNIGPG